MAQPKDLTVWVAQAWGDVLNQIANLSPFDTATTTTEDLPITSVGTEATPAPAPTNLAASVLR